MSTVHLASRAAHSDQGRILQPIDFSEHWSLCHHLACVVECVARAGRKHSTLDQTRLGDLKTAEWYLMREITNKRPCVFSSIQNTHDHPIPITLEAAVLAWDLSTHLKEVLFYITTYQRLLYRFPSTRVICLSIGVEN